MIPVIIAPIKKTIPPIIRTTPNNSGPTQDIRAPINNDGNHNKPKTNDQVANGELVISLSTNTR